METFDTNFSLKLAYLIFSAVEQFSTNLQAKDTTVEEGTGGPHPLRAHNTSLPSETAFTTFSWSTVEFASGLTDEPALPRYCKTPRRIDKRAQPHRYTSPEERYRQVYLEALGSTGGEIEKRFDQFNLVVVCDVELLLVDAAMAKMYN